MNYNDIRAALRLLEKLAYPRGDWRDDEARRRARILVKKMKRKLNKYGIQNQDQGQPR